MMKPTPIDVDEPDFDGPDFDRPPDTTANEHSSATLAVLEPADDVEEQDATWSGPRCEKCDAPIKSDGVAICRKCGWYANLGTFVELDPNWEVEDEADTAAAKPQTSHLNVWLEMIPRWGWVIIASVLAVIVESAIARLITPAGSSLRTTWSLVQLALGVLAVAGCHVFNFLVLATEDADVGLLDLVVKPVRLWVRTVQRLPTRLWVVDAAASGLTAAVMSVIVIGGIPYDRFWDWGFTPPPKQDLMGAVTDRIKQLDDGSGADNLEGAIGDFAGSGDLSENESPSTPPPKPRGKADCVILGYQVNREGRLSTLVLGTAHLGRLVYAGQVTPRLDDPAEAEQLLAKLAAVRTQQRLVAVEISASWVKPKYACRVTFDERKRNGRLTDIKWDSLLGAMRTK